MDEDLGEDLQDDQKSKGEAPTATWMEKSEPASSGFGCFRVMLAGLTGVVGLCAGVPLSLLAVWSCVAVITLLRDYTTGLSPDVTTLGCLWRFISISMWLSVVSAILDSL